MTDTTRKPGQADRLYEQLLDMVVSFQLRPGDRINEVQLSQRLGASRTPLREALNRLAAQRLIRSEPGRGYFCWPIKPAQIRDLFQARAAVECYAVQLVCEQASPETVTALTDYLDSIEPAIQTCSTAELLGYDENFHARLVDASGNSELKTMLDTLNARLRYVRWIQMDKPGARDSARHRDLLAPILRRDAAAARAAMEAHIETRLEQITDAVGKAHIRIFVEDSDAALPPLKQDETT